METDKYIFTTDEFKKMHEQSQEIFGNLSIIKNFCKDYEDIDGFYKVVPLINYTKNTAERLFIKFIETE